jgi:hypothetical protein
MTGSLEVLDASAAPSVHGRDTNGHAVMLVKGCHGPKTSRFELRSDLADCDHQAVIDRSGSAA